MACSYRMSRVFIGLRTSAFSRTFHNLSSNRTSTSWPRYALNNIHCGGKRLQRNLSDLPRRVPDPPQARDLRSLTEEFQGATDEAVQGRLFAEYLKTPVEHVPGKAKTVADVLVAENGRIVRSSFVYAGLIGALVFGGAVVLSQTESKSLARITPGSHPSIRDLRTTREKVEMSAAQQSVDRLRKYLNKSLLQYYAQWRLAYLNASDGKKAAYMIAGVNIAVYCAWQVASLALKSPRMPNLYPFMRTWFLHAPLASQPLRRAITPITSTFSHISLMHVLFNNICMLSFATGAGLYLSSLNVQSGGKFEHGYREPQELSGKYHFLAFFITAGVFSALGSTLHAQFLQKRVLRSVGPTLDAFRRSTIPGLGASGAVYSVVVVSVFADPNGEVGIILLSNLFPFLNVEKKYGVTALVALDIVGLLAGWRTFGHAAHLGGAAFGAAYCFFGPRMWATLRGPEI